jgi:hypothetical protein
MGDEWTRDARLQVGLKLRVGDREARVEHDSSDGPAWFWTVLHVPTWVPLGSGVAGSEDEAKAAALAVVKGEVR